MVFQPYVFILFGVIVELSYYLIFFSLWPLWNEIHLHENQTSLSWNKSLTVKQAETNKITHSKKTVLVKYLKRKMLSFNLLVDVPPPTLQRCNQRSCKEKLPATCYECHQHQLHSYPTAEPIRGSSWYVWPNEAPKSTLIQFLKHRHTLVTTDLPYTFLAKEWESITQSAAKLLTQGLAHGFCSPNIWWIT